MICNAVVTTSPNSFSVSRFDVEDIKNGVISKVFFSSICGTDHKIFSGDLLYYKNDIAKYPIVTGHEWCGEYEGTPVVGTCILGCGDCYKCNNDQPMHCDYRREVGVVNKHGAHAEYVFMPSTELIPIPTVSPKYALTEPMAVCVHAMRRLNLSTGSKILIVGYGCIGKMCGEVLKSSGYSFKVYDPRFTEDVDPRGFDIILECSGNKKVLNSYLQIKGITILLFGFEYDDISPSILSSNEIKIIGTLGSNRDDFVNAIDIISNINLEFFHIIPFMRFKEGVASSRAGEKVIFKH